MTHVIHIFFYSFNHSFSHSSSSACIAFYTVLATQQRGEDEATSLKSLEKLELILFFTSGSLVVL